MKKDILFSINRDKVEISEDYDRIQVKIRFSVTIGNIDFYMDKKMFKHLLKSSDIKEYILNDCNDVLNFSKPEIEKHLLNIKKIYSKKELKLDNIYFVGYGFSILFNIYNNSFNPMTEEHLKYYL